MKDLTITSVIKVYDMTNSMTQTVPYWMTPSKQPGAAMHLTRTSR